MYPSKGLMVRLYKASQYSMEANKSLLMLEKKLAEVLLQRPTRQKGSVAAA